VIKQVFGTLAKHIVKLNGLKCQFLQAEVKCMGHILSIEGISPVKSKLDVVRSAPRCKVKRCVSASIISKNVEILLEVYQRFFIQSARTLPTRTGTRPSGEIEKEGLAITFGIRRFQLYLSRRKFTLVMVYEYEL